jgi:hypothetical protein
MRDKGPVCLGQWTRSKEIKSSRDEEREAMRRLSTHHSDQFPNPWPRRGVGKLRRTCTAHPSTALLSCKRERRGGEQSRERGLDRRGGER